MTGTEAGCAKSLLLEMDKRYLKVIRVLSLAKSASAFNTSEIYLWPVILSRLL